MLTQASDSLNKFSMALYSKVVANKPKENMFYSPASIYVALAMTYVGTRGNTAKEIEHVMNWKNPETVNEMIQSLQEPIFAASGVELSLANRLWVQQGYAILKEYTDMLQSFYQAEMGTADFVNKATEARETINNWVETKTNGNIKDLIEDDVLTSLTRLVLANAVYFKGFWEKRFNKRHTHTVKFKVSKTETVKVRMMNQTGVYLYEWNEELSCKILKLPYTEKKVAMVIFLPDEVDGLVELENKLNADHIRNCDTTMSSRSVNVGLPRLKLNCQFNMNDILSLLGICDLFDIRNADLSGVTGDSQLYVSDAIHQAFVNVDEEGTEAAAATAVVMNIRCSPPRPEVFLADHPFLFVIQHCESGAILFQSRVLSPEYERDR